MFAFPFPHYLNLVPSEISLPARAGLCALVQISEVIPIKNTFKNLFCQKTQTTQNQPTKNTKKNPNT